MTEREEEVVVNPGALTRGDVEEVVSYWTDERRESAEPIPMPELEQRREAQAAPARGEPVVELAVPPEDYKEELAACFTTTKVSNMNIWPYMAVGKMFMKFPNGGNYQGSAWTIYASSVFTAGHCVYQKSLGGWATNIIFYPRYNNGSTIGSWVAKQSVAPNGWVNNTDYAYDIGAYITTTKIGPTSGTLGWIANSAPNYGSPFTSVGYPAQPITGYNFDGKYMWQSVGSYISGTTILKMCNNMTGGCSGGPWSIVHAGVNAYAKGVNSHRYNSDPKSLYSPAFQQAFLNITTWLKANGGN